MPFVVEINQRFYHFCHEDSQAQRCPKVLCFIHPCPFYTNTYFHFNIENKYKLLCLLWLKFTKNFIIFATKTQRRKDDQRFYVLYTHVHFNIENNDKLLCLLWLKLTTKGTKEGLRNNFIFCHEVTKAERSTKKG